MAQKPINMKLVREVLTHIKSDIRRLEMNRYGVKQGSSAIDPDSDHFEGGLTNEKFPECRTKCCFGGWGVFLTTPKSKRKNLFWKSGEMKNQFERARKLFGFSADEADSIFSGESLWKDTTRGQLQYLRLDINEVLKERGMTERV